MSRISVFSSFLALIIIVWISGCIQTDLTDFIRDIPEVSNFLEEHPEAEISMVLLSNEYVENNMDEVPEKCLPTIEEGKNYYNAEIIENTEEISVWISENEKKVVCVYRKGTPETQKPNLQISSPIFEEIHLSEYGIESMGWVLSFNIANEDDKNYMIKFCDPNVLPYCNMKEVNIFGGHEANVGTIGALANEKFVYVLPWPSTISEDLEARCFEDYGKSPCKLWYCGQEYEFDVVWEPENGEGYEKIETKKIKIDC